MNLKLRPLKLLEGWKRSCHAMRWNAGRHRQGATLSPVAWLSGCRHPPLYSKKTRRVCVRQVTICLETGVLRKWHRNEWRTSQRTKKAHGLSVWQKDTGRLKVDLNAGRESNLQHPHNSEVFGIRDLITQQWERGLAAEQRTPPLISCRPVGVPSDFLFLKKKRKDLSKIV